MNKTELQQIVHLIAQQLLSESQAKKYISQQYLQIQVLRAKSFFQVQQATNIVKPKQQDAEENLQRITQSREEFLKKQRKQMNFAQTLHKMIAELDATRMEMQCMQTKQALENTSELGIMIKRRQVHFLDLQELYSGYAVRVVEQFLGHGSDIIWKHDEQIAQAYVSSVNTSALAAQHLEYAALLHDAANKLHQEYDQVCKQFRSVQVFFALFQEQRPIVYTDLQIVITL